MLATTLRSRPSRTSPRHVALLGLASVLVSTATFLGLGPPPTVTVASTALCTHAPAYGWLHTSGQWILDQNGCRVRLVSVNWFGMETRNYVPDGLNFESYTTILSQIKALGFNSIRLSISEEMVRDNLKLHPNPDALKMDLELKHLHPLGILDRIVTAAQADGLWIILDNHGSLASPEYASFTEPTWNYYTEQGWIDDWITLAERYLKHPTVVGFDLRNEPHTAGPGPWTLRTYLTQGATWGKYPSKLWKQDTDWAAAATNAGNAILAVNPHLLMFVEGVELYPDPTQYRGVETYWWGSILRGVTAEPVVFKVPHQLVYAPHEWGPRRTPYPYFNSKTSNVSLDKIFYQNWDFILHSTNPKILAPIWIGEFNTCNFNVSCVNNWTRGSQGQWFQIFVQYLKANPQIGWAYYPINGTNGQGKMSNNSILDKTWKNVRLPQLMTHLRPIMGQPPQVRHGRVVQS